MPHIVTEAQQRENDELLKFITDRKLQAFEYAHYLIRATPEHLKHCGHKDIGSALVATITRAAREVEQKIVAFEKKYPND